MCGITGILHKNAHAVLPGVLQTCTGKLIHRGPDAEGYYLKGPVGLGHRRLSIIDLGLGHQPMTTPDGRYTLVFNGEIYNYAEIRSELQQAGRVFKTHSDTEVLLEGFVRWGEGVLHKLNGMFAFAVWDEEDKKLFVARDRFGKKPFYYWDGPKAFVFASELKAVAAHPDFSRELDIEALGYYFQHEYVPAPYSIFKGIRKLPAGHTLLWENNRLEIKKWWDVSLGPPCDLSEEEMAFELLARLDKAVATRLVSDVPLGVFLSGGIDSSSIVALMGRHRVADQIKTFSIGFNEASYDESGIARDVARRFGTDHHEEILTPQAMLDILPEVTDFMDEPFADYSIIPTFLLSRFTRQFVTVALGGDGSDEIFGGYPTFFAGTLADRFNRLPSFFRRGLERLVSAWPVSDKDMSFEFKLKQFLYGAHFPPVLRNQVWLGAFHRQEMQTLFAAGLPVRDPLQLVADVMQSCPSSHPGDRMLYFYQKFYLEGDILVKTDRASMAASLEVRAPFLDVNLAEFVSKIPYRLKTKRGQTKIILKKALENILPEEVLARKKKGFGIPLAAWLKGPLREKMLSDLAPEKIKREGLFDADFVSKLVADHLAGRRNNRKQIFALLMFEWWRESHLD